MQERVSMAKLTRTKVAHAQLDFLTEDGTMVRSEFRINKKERPFITNKLTKGR